jgi:Hypothetical protein (DUF2513)
VDAVPQMQRRQIHARLTRHWHNLAALDGHMKMDWDLIRDILIAVEECPLGNHIKLDQFSGHSQSVVFEHIRLLKEDGYLHAQLLPYHTGQPGGDAVVQRMSMSGHELLETMRSKPVWEKIKALAKEKGLELGLDAIKALGGIALKWVVGK